VSALDVRVVDCDTKLQNSCFHDFAESLRAALRDLGHDVGPGGRQIVLGANDAETRVEIPADAIIFNAEQVADAVDPSRLIARIRPEQVIWDYSERNVARWRALGFSRAMLCPVGYHPSMETISPVPVEFVDVLFYGWMSEHRRETLEALAASGLRVKRLSGVYGSARDWVVARSKIVLNLHFGDGGIFEIFRCSHLFANRRCVVTEDGGSDPALEGLARRSCAYVARDKIVETCAALAASELLRRQIAERGYSEFKKLDLIEGVRRALTASGAVTPGGGV
jgi:hypothetical protein